ncbi:MAG: hypothetical protein U9Q81_23760 [Pseudomonadota bacterium]|nr:hypothetical protein [Pseudomonadota bacterium]
MATLTDRFGRRIDYLRVSVTDRCNYRIGGSEATVGVISALSRHFCDGCYSRRINIQHRLVDRVVHVLRMWTHYD